MKKIFITISIATLLLPACSDNKTKEDKRDNGTHQHEDGSEHQNHADDTAKQEEFIVPSDTTLNKTGHEKEHMHDGSEHPHQH